MTTTVPPAPPHRHVTGARRTSPYSWTAGAVAVLVLAASALVGAAAPASATDWTPAVDLSAAGENAADPRIAVSADGLRATAAWTRFDGANGIVQARSSTDGGVTWGPATDLSAAGGDANDPQIASSADGSRVTVAWSRFDGGEEVVQARSSTDGGVSWGTVVALSLAGESAYEPQVATSADGSRVTVVWRRFDGANFLVQARTSPDGGQTWGSVRTLSASGRNASGPQVAVSASGSRVTAVWHRSDGSDFLVQARSSADGGATWSGVRTLSAAGESADRQQVALSADGTRVAVAWHRSDGAHTIVQARSSTDGGATWGVVADLSAPGRNATAPQVAASADGARVTVVWQRSDGANSIVQARTSTDGGATWGVVSDLSATGQNATAPQLVTSADGMTATSAWYRPDGSHLIVQARASADGGATWGAVSDLSAPGQDADAVRIDGASDGSRTAAVWARSDGATDIVQVASGLEPVPGLPSSTPTATADDGTDAGSTGTAPVVVQRQRPTRPLGLPARVARTGTTRLVRLPVTTNAGQDARVRVRCSIRPRRGGSAADTATGATRACRVIRTTSAVRVRVSGSHALRVTVRLRAPEVPGFTAYSSRTTYRVRPAR